MSGWMQVLSDPYGICRAKLHAWVLSIGKCTSDVLDHAGSIIAWQATRCMRVEVVSSLSSVSAMSHSMPSVVSQFV